MEYNPYRYTAFVCAGIILLGAILIFLPGMLHMDMLKNGMALSFFGGFVVIVGIIAIVIFARFARLFGTIFQKENILVHWTYSPEEWQRYSIEEYRQNKSEKWRLFILVVVISVIVGLILWAVYPHDLKIIVYIIIGIIIVMGITAYLTALLPYRQDKKRQGEVYIAKDGAYINRRMHFWKGLGTRLRSASYEAKGTSLPRIRIRYSSYNVATGNYYTARIPVPPGQEEKAQKVVAEILENYQSSKKSGRK